MNRQNCSRKAGAMSAEIDFLPTNSLGAAGFKSSIFGSALRDQFWQFVSS
jgi:hypothetical protein